MTPLGKIVKRAAEKYEIHETDLQTAGTGMETLPDPPMVAASTPSPSSP
jgi:hypothetical protein